MKLEELCAAVQEARYYNERFTRREYTSAFRTYTERFGPLYMEAVRETAEDPDGRRVLAEQLLDLLECGCQVRRFLRTECGQALLGGVQLLLEGLLAAVCGCTVLACQSHDCLYLGFGQALDCSQIFTFHWFLPLGLRHVFRPATTTPNPPDSARRQRS